MVRVQYGFRKLKECRNYYYMAAANNCTKKTAVYMSTK